MVYYEYPNGLYFGMYGDYLNQFGFQDRYRSIRPFTITRKKCDIFSNPGDELLIFFEYGMNYRLLVCAADTREVLREYYLDFIDMYQIETGDFMNDGSLQLYLDGLGEGIYKKGIYQVVNDDFVEVFNTSSFKEYNNDIKAAINNSSMSMSVSIGSYNNSFTSVIPEIVFYDTWDVQDRTSLLEIDSDWEVVNKNGKWFVQVLCKVNYPMIYYYWGPPDFDITPNEVMYNDLARVFVDLSLTGHKYDIADVRAEVKYDDPDLLSIKALDYDEIRLVDGPAVEMTMEQAYEALGGNMEEFEYSESIEYNGVGLFEFCGCIVEITVTSPEYETPRGLRVGDTIEKVERLYGKPDQGFSGDEYVVYKCSANYYRGMDICYKDNAVEKIILYQHILD